MAILEISRGAEPMPVLGICDHKGVMHRYQVSPSEVPGMVFACDLPASNGKGDLYTVWLTPGGDWGCNCPDYHYRQKRESGDPCKHTEAVSQHYDGLEIFFMGIERWREVRAALQGKQLQPS